MDIQALQAEHDRLATTLKIMQAPRVEPTETDIGDVVDALDGLTEDQAAPFLHRLNDLIADVLTFRMRILKDQMETGEPCRIITFAPMQDSYASGAA